MNNKKKIHEMKEFIYQTTKKELQENHLDCHIFPVTTLEFYHKIFSSKEYDLIKKIFTFSLPFNSCGFYNQHLKEITIFLNHFLKIEDDNLCQFVLLFVCCHEIRHLYQDSFFSINTLEGYLKYIEKNIRRFDFSDDYLFYHDKYSSEIGANLYGIQKAKKYFLQKYPNQLDYIKNIYDKIEQQFMIDYFSYDPIDTINCYILLMQKRYKEAHFILSTNKEFPLPDKVSSIFLNDDYTCKSLTEIINHPKLSSISNELIYSFITSEVFLNHIPYSSLNQEEKELFSKAINYAKIFYQNQKNTLTKYGIPHFSQNDKKKISNPINTLLKGKDTPLRSEEKKKKHLENILVLEKKIKNHSHF